MAPLSPTITETTLLSVKEDSSSKKRSKKAYVKKSKKTASQAQDSEMESNEKTAS